MFDVVSIGNATMDAFVKINPKRHFRKSRGELFFAQGSKIEAEELGFFSGGSATNTAVSFSRMGLKTGCICRVGQDEFGNEVIRELKAEGVDASMVLRSKDLKTAFSVILTGHGLNRVIFAYGGATSQLDSHGNQVDWKRLSKSRFVYLGSLHASLKLVSKIATFCRTKGVPLAWNPGQSELKNGLEKLRPILREVSVLFLNGEEARQLIGKKDYKKNAAELAKLVPLVVISLGPIGAAAFDGKQFRFEASHAAKKIDSTGAGDAFNSGFLAAWIAGKPVSFCLKNGVDNATSVIRFLGAKNRLLHKKLQ